VNRKSQALVFLACPLLLAFETCCTCEALKRGMQEAYLGTTWMRMSPSLGAGADLEGASLDICPESCHLKMRKVSAMRLYI
jgi:hypothetical protein